MILSHITPGPDPPDRLAHTSPPDMTQWLCRDRLLLGAFLVCGLLIGYQLGVTLLQPPWIGPVTDWLRAALAWPELLVVVGVAFKLSRARPRCALSFWMLSVALLSYTVARTLWTLSNRLIFSHGVPFPTLPDLFFVLQYPFFFLAVILMPSIPPWSPRLKMILDCLFWTGTATALSWYFILAPIFMQSGISPLAKYMCLAYPVGDLALLVGLVLALVRPRYHQADRVTLFVLCLALVSLILADSWVDSLLLVNPRHVYVTGHPPDLFWLTFYLLIPLASLVRLRVAQQEPPKHVTEEKPKGWQLQRQDLTASLRLFVPIVAVLLASALILARAIMIMGGAGWRSLIPPLVVSLGLLLVIIARQEITFLEHAWMCRERATTRAGELALRELDRRKGEFLSILSHELRTPLASVQGYLQLLVRRFDAARPHAHGVPADVAEHEAGRLAPDVALTCTLLGYVEVSLQRITRLADDLVDDERIRDGRLTMRRASCDLGAIVRAAVEEQRALNPDRSIELDLPTGQATTVIADADHIAQVVTNYLTNALKYSRPERTIAVRLQVERVAGGGDRARVWVRDEGVGLSLEEQARVFERFPQIEGRAVQSGSGVSLGLGLYISRRIIEEHQGEVGVHSSPGQGATFFFTLPLAHPPS